MAGEFYFAAAKDAADGCGCSTPVADVLGLLSVELAEHPQVKAQTGLYSYGLCSYGL